ncbi:hypothetical protein Nepgr_028145 [Nepenthes gracilis]|uniref:HMG box domain-containing protein n=1 Tax=Nepenthes gracilis TaxID=150966 RepID=A0AAD3TBE3_NEPGR|nr:hypothetical protein Nepgr_028145 [Nepenthes gracilis]
MAKKASESHRSVSSASSIAKPPPTRKVVSKVKSTENDGIVWNESKNDEIEVRPRSVKKRKGTTKKKKIQKLDSKKPKKPPTAFFYFLKDFRKEYQEHNPEVKSMRDLGKACGEKWKTMTYEEKVQYYDMAAEKRAEFDRMMAEYNKRQETGEDQQHEDSEFDE